MEPNYVAVVVAALVVVVVSTVYYIAFGKQYAQLRGLSAEEAAARPPIWKPLLEVLRNLILATVVACISCGLELTEPGEAVLLALGLWIAFPAMLLMGSVMWDQVPVKLAAMHAGDWLLKLLIITVLVTVWR